MPPRCRPAPPEPSASSRRRKRSGDCASVISTGIAPTPLGKAVVDRPSLAGRAPMPPMPIEITLKRVASGFAPSICGPPERPRIHMLPAPSAGTLPRSGSSKQPNTSSGSIWPMTWRAVTGARPQRMDDGILGRGDGDHLQRAGVVRDARRDDALHAERGVGVGVALGRIDAEARGGRGAGVVDVDRAVAHGERGLQLDRRLVAVQRHRRAPGAARQLADRGAHRVARGGDDVFAQRIELRRGRTPPASPRGAASPPRCRRPGRAGRRAPACGSRTLPIRIANRVSFGLPASIIFMCGT